jgi:hypothetical protein
LENPLEYNKLNKISDEATIINLLSGAKENNAEVFVWKLIGASKYLAQVRIESLRKSRKDFCLIPTEGQDRLVQDLMNDQIYIDLYIPDSALLLRCCIKTSDAPRRYYLQIPAYVVQVDRRKSTRLRTYESSEVRISFGKSALLPKPMTQHFHKECCDISAGGFSFYVSKLEMKFFLTNDNIPALEIKAGNWATKVSAQIATIREIEPDEYNGLSYRVWRVSCRFTLIDQIGRKYLEKFIFERIKQELHAINY